MKSRCVGLSGAIALAMSSFVHSSVLSADQVENTYLDAENTMSEKVSLSDKVKVKSVILFVGDGMGIFTLGIGAK